MPFTNPETNLAQLSLQSGMTVVDFGAGSGAYSLAASRRVAPSGKVYAIDIQKELLERLSRQARALGIFNVEVIWGDLDKPGGSKLRDGIADAVIISNTLLQSENRENFVAEAFRVLKSGGQVLFIDWSDASTFFGRQARHLVSPQTSRELFVKTGFLLVKNFEAGEHHYGMVFKKP